MILCALTVSVSLLEGGCLPGDREDDEDYALGEDDELNRYRERFGLDSVYDIEAIIRPSDIPEERIFIRITCWLD